MWQNLLLAFIGGWTCHAVGWRIVRRMKHGSSFREAVQVAGRRIPHVTEVP
jgi:hypothetical protein